MKTVVNSVIQCWAEVSPMMLSCGQIFLEVILCSFNQKHKACTNTATALRSRLWTGHCYALSKQVNIQQSKRWEFFALY